MSSIETLALDTRCSPAQLWSAIATSTKRWLEARSIAAVDAYVLVPFMELLAPARQAFAQSPGWMPRVHTTQTLAREFIAPRPRHTLGPCGNFGTDVLAADRLLRGQAWANAWASRDFPAFDHAVSRIVRTAHTLTRGAAAVAPKQRPLWWERARVGAALGSGVASTDRALLRMAIEWAAAADEPETDALFGLRPGAWIAVELGGADELAVQLLAHAQSAGLPALRLQTDAGDADPIAALARCGEVELVCAVDAEEEAWAAAFEVTKSVQQGESPVALIAEDRALVRRVRALLERTGTAIDDETGWSLATTRAGAHVNAAMRAADPAAGQDDWLDWLKADVALEDGSTLAALEQQWRRRSATDTAAPMQTRTEALWRKALQRLATFATPRRKTLAQWLRALDTLVFAASQRPAWHNDQAAAQLRAALQLGEGGLDAARQAVSDTAMDLDDFGAWIDRCLEDARLTLPQGATAAPVVLTPMSRAIGRNFRSVVVPGADERRLVADTASDLLLSDAALRDLGLPHRRSRQVRQAQVFAQLLRVPKLVLIRRRADGDEMLAPSPLVDRLMLRCHALGVPLPRERAPGLPMRTVVALPLSRPLPIVNGRMPASLSASAVEALRQCPYRFFARSVLRLSEQEELDDEVDKRDYGRWLHATLEQFHATRVEPTAVADDIERLEQVARQVLRAMVDAGEFSESSLLPYWAGFGAFAPRYIDWLHAHEAQGWRFSAAEVDQRLDAQHDSRLQLHGRIDRIDTHSRANAIYLIDYKTSARSALTRKVAQPLEDTQLAVYGALLAGTVPADAQLSAVYLALDDSESVSEVEHPDVAQTARQLIQALALEQARILGGAPLPALGQGPVCDTCEARGLCRRDHWPWQEQDA